MDGRSPSRAGRAAGVRPRNIRALEIWCAKIRLYLARPGGRHIQHIVDAGRIRNRSSASGQRADLSSLSQKRCRNDYKDEALQIALQALEATLETLDCANAEPGGCIATLSHTESETLFDYLTDRINADPEGNRHIRANVSKIRTDGGREAFERGGSPTGSTLTTSKMLAAFLKGLEPL